MADSQLEQELEQARRHGRWLADDEREALALAQRQQAEAALAQRHRRRKLLLLTGFCVLIPPLWPLALALVLYLLFPRTTQRFGLIAGVLVLLGASLLAVLLLSVAVAVLLALF
ncbi:MAG: hypothetical protein FJ078_07775 [Cyanobacteria bacterium K_DeepCast_35m_m2_155]|nr:hypothetical protein [Cyanobacteria bacterium K_DeepCast_35m_m2_155]